jgi:hypothetical protein
MAVLTAKARSKIPAGKFAGPDRSYPVEDKAHARAALSRASGAVNAGRMSEAEKVKIDRKADAVLGHKKQKTEPVKSDRGDFRMKG